MLPKPFTCFLECQFWILILIIISILFNKDKYDLKSLELKNFNSKSIVPCT